MEWAGIFIHRTLHLTVNSQQHVDRNVGGSTTTKKVGVVDVQNFEFFSRFGNFILICSWVSRWYPLQEVVVTDRSDVDWVSRKPE